MTILGIETSCDDTGISVVKVAEQELSFKILSNIVSSQIKVHQKYGGVVPNLAAREHLKNINPCLKTALAKAKTNFKDIDLIAPTTGPGLIPSLLVGVNFAKTLAYIWEKPIIGVNHIQAHIIAGLTSTGSKFKAPDPSSLPAIALIVSGGHTQLVLVTSPKNSTNFWKIKYEILGETRDDAAGECFDKIAKLLELGYPGGPKISAQADEFRKSKSELKINLPRPMINHKSYDFSFSGLKTAVLYLVKERGVQAKTEKFVQALCAEAQQAIIDVLIKKTIRAAKKYNANTVILAGGVAANKQLRKQLESKVGKIKSPTQFSVPPKSLCTDNGAMIAMAGYFEYNQGAKTNWKKIQADANLRLGKNKS